MDKLRYLAATRQLEHANKSLLQKEAAWTPSEMKKILLSLNDSDVLTIMAYGECVFPGLFQASRCRVFERSHPQKENSSRNA